MNSPNFQIKEEIELLMFQIVTKYLTRKDFQIRDSRKKLSKTSNKQLSISITIIISTLTVALQMQNLIEKAKVKQVLKVILADLKMPLGNPSLESLTN